MLLALSFLLLSRPTTLDVGDNKPFSRIEEAALAAHAGDEIRVFPRADGYLGTAVYITTPKLKIVAESRIILDGSSFSYSGVGKVPRAIFQVNPGADGVTIENFELKGAHNASYNGAGLRIYGAKSCTIRDCSIHDNDMGIMSAGVVGDSHSASKQLIDHCEIYRNGNIADPGYNHNLYLGGTSATVQFCSIHDSLTGHNLKSRAHFTIVQYCAIYNSCNREMDFVESWDTERPHSNVLLLGNVIHKNPDCKGNRTVILFGEEKGHRDGTIFLINNNISTDFMSPVVELTALTPSARFFNNVIENSDQAHPELVGFPNGADLSDVKGRWNVLSPNYDVAGTSIDKETVYTDRRARQKIAGHPRPPLTFHPGQASYVDGEGNRHDVAPIYRAKSFTWSPTTETFIGAG